MDGIQEMAEAPAREEIVRLAIAAGVQRVYTLPGDLAYGLLTAFDRAGVPVVSCRSQASAVFAAAAENMATGRLSAIVIVTRGPAFANALAALSSVLDHGTPMVLISPGELQAETRERAFQGGVPLRLAEGADCAWCEVVETAALAPVVEDAVSGASGVACRSAVVMIDRTVLGETVAPAAARPVAPRSEPDREAAAQAITALVVAERPVVVVGHRARWSVGVDEIAEAARRLAAPVCTTGLATGFGGDALATVPVERSHATLAQADLVMLLGAPRDWSLRHGAGISPSASVIDLPGPGGPSGRDGDIRLSGPISPALAALVAGVKGPANAASPATHALPPHKPATLFGEIAAALAAEVPPNTAVVVDGSNQLINATRHVLPRATWARFTPGRSGHLGSGPGQAIGAALSGRFEQVILLSGDLSLGLALADLETMVRYALPIRILVDNNGGLGSGAVQTKGADPRIAANAPTDHAAIIRAMGGLAWTVTCMQDWPAARDALFSQSGPGVVDVRL
ncbi:thiamine pyrophosphate-binding protein [Maritimibacter sp. UBA3975]|uniref:thiamine pyrophosphate-binding protein n=1 Tax=Maritimibacter sp. UBA3975 TaxID=1946833 RepID=UPI0025BAB530|nr:thiamine pyrophosphate-binding protein [Maritimibacter sp. UBA3975]